MEISIIIAAYNVEPYILKCIESCLHQNIAKNQYEIIIVNDGSTDNSLAIIEKLRLKNSNIIVVNQKNQGLGAARNSGLLKAKGEYVWFIDGDDYIAENCLQSITNEFNRNKLDVLVLNYAVVTTLGEVNRNIVNRTQLHNTVVTGGEYYKNNYYSSYTWLYVYKKTLFIENKILFKERINMQDSEILPKLLYHTTRLSFLDKVCYYYVQQADSFTNSSNGQKRYNYFLSIIEVRNLLKDFLENTAHSNPEISFGIKQKLQGLHHVVFNHLIFFKYDKDWLIKIIQLLKENGFYPLKHQAKGKMKIIKWGLNHHPIFIKNLIDGILQLRNK